MADQSERLRRWRGLTVMNGAATLIALMIIVQMWVLTATLESHLAGHDTSVLPATIVSALCFAVCFALYRFTVRVDRRFGQPRA